MKDSADAVHRHLERIGGDLRKRSFQALADGGLFVLSDDKDGKVIVPADKIGYLEFAGVEQRRVGFSSL